MNTVLGDVDPLVRNTPSPGGKNTELETMVEQLYDSLDATAEIPIDDRTNRWLGEAEAVAHDAATSDLEPAVIRKRVRQVAHLLEEAESPDNDRAAQRVYEAHRLCEEILAYEQ